MIVVEKGIPIPTGGQRGRKAIWPLRTMEVGDSFLVPTEESNRVRAAISHLHRMAPEQGRQFTSRQVEGGYRFWRFA